MRKGLGYIIGTERKGNNECERVREWRKRDVKNKKNEYSVGIYVCTMYIAR